MSKHKDSNQERERMSDAAFDDPDIQLSENVCPKCSATAYRRDCSYCDEDGFSYHDCGEDTCCCFMPEDNVRCDFCRGRGYHEWCRKCGWDLLEKRYLK